MTQVTLAERIRALGCQVAIILSPREVSQTACFNIQQFVQQADSSGHITNTHSKNTRLTSAWKSGSGQINNHVVASKVPYGEGISSSTMHRSVVDPGFQSFKM